jgi:hypothetical protein
MKREDAAKWELIRRLRYGALLKLLRHRWGHVLPDDDTGRDDLWLLVTNVSLAAAEPKKKMRHVIEIWAPWMSAEEREAYVEHVGGLDIYERTPTAKALGQRLGLTNAEREALKLWQFLPIDKTDAEIAELAKARDRERRARKRRANGVRTREAYLAELASRPQPWIAEGISRRTWQRRRMSRCVCGDQTCVSRGDSEILVFKRRTHVATPDVGDLRKEGHQGSVLVENPRQIATEAERMETKASSSPEPRIDPATENDPRIAALKNWGRAAQRIASKSGKHDA